MLIGMLMGVSMALIDEHDWGTLARLRSAEKLSLTDLDHCIRRFKERPVHEISAFRGALRIARLPGPLRRLRTSPDSASGH